MFQWYNIAVGAWNRVSPIEPWRVTHWPHLLHRKVYVERSPGKRFKSSGPDFIWMLNYCNISRIDSNIECFSNLWWNKFVNIDRGICIVSNAMSTISSINWLLHFSFNTCWSNIFPLLPVPDSPSSNLDKQGLSVEEIWRFKLDDRFPSKSVRRKSMREFRKLQWRLALLWLANDDHILPTGKSPHTLTPLTPPQPDTCWRYDWLQQWHLNCIWNVPPCWTDAILPDGSRNITEALYARHSHQSLGGWHFQNHAKFSCGLGQWWQCIDSTTSLLLSLLFSVIYFTMAQ
jgi:hypothetical protein